MTTILRTAVFDRWLKKLKDRRGKARIIERIRSLERGHVGDCAPLGSGVAELRIHFGPGYRIYFMRTGETQLLLLIGGTKKSQDADIRKAKALAALVRRK